MGAVAGLSVTKADHSATRDLRQGMPSYVGRTSSFGYNTETVGSVLYCCHTASSPRNMPSRQRRRCSAGMRPYGISSRTWPWESVRLCFTRVQSYRDKPGLDCSRKAHEICLRRLMSTPAIVRSNSSISCCGAEQICSSSEVHDVEIRKTQGLGIGSSSSLCRYLMQAGRQQSPLTIVPCVIAAERIWTWPCEYTRFEEIRQLGVQALPHQAL